jgi:hypothetical protein
VLDAAQPTLKSAPSAGAPMPSHGAVGNSRLA